MDKIILALESSCDETACAILKNDELIANVISSQIEVHQKYGGSSCDGASTYSTSSNRSSDTARADGW